MAHSPHLYFIMSRYPSWIMSLFGSFFSGIRVEDTALRTKPERAMRTFGLVYCCLEELKMLWFTTKLFFFSLPKLTHVLYWSSGILTKKNLKDL